MISLAKLVEQQKKEITYNIKKKGISKQTHKKKLAE